MNAMIMRVYVYESPWWLRGKKKNLPAMKETWVCSLGQEDPLEKEIATHSSILAWRIPWTESLADYSSVQSLSYIRLFETP